MIIGYLIENNMTKAIYGDLEKHAYSVNDSISDPNIRNMNIFSADRKIGYSSGGYKIEDRFWTEQLKPALEKAHSGTDHTFSAE